MDEKTVSEALLEIAKALDRLGNGSASTSLGGLENLSMAILDASKNIQSGLEAVAVSNRDGK